MSHDDDQSALQDLVAIGAAIDAARQRTRRQLASLERSFGDIVEATELDPPDDEHDPEGSTIAYERAQVSALIDQAREDVVALDVAAQRVAGGAATTCERCRAPIAVERLIALPTTVVCVSCARTSALWSGTRRDVPPVS